MRGHDGVERVHVTLHVPAPTVGYSATATSNTAQPSARPGPSASQQSPSTTTGTGQVGSPAGATIKQLPGLPFPAVKGPHGLPLPVPGGVAAAAGTPGKLPAPGAAAAGAIPILPNFANMPPAVAAMLLQKLTPMQRLQLQLQLAAKQQQQQQQPATRPALTPAPAAPKRPVFKWVTCG